jgi:hypothetical protein
VKQASFTFQLEEQIMTTMTPEMEALKARLKATWISADYGPAISYVADGLVSISFMDLVRMNTPHGNHN